MCSGETHYGCCICLLVVLDLAIFVSSTAAEQLFPRMFHHMLPTTILVLLRGLLLAILGLVAAVLGLAYMEIYNDMLLYHRCTFHYIHGGVPNRVTNQLLL